MTKRMKILIAVVASVLVVGIIGTVAVMAQTPTPTTGGTPPPRPNINAMVAAKLGHGITEAQLTDSMKEARTVLAPAPANPAIPPATPVKPVRPAPFDQTAFYARVATILNTKVPGAGITGDQIAAAYQQAFKDARDQAINAGLENAKANGKITDAEEAQIKQWYQSRPAALDKLGMPSGLGQMRQRMQGAMNNFQNHMNDFQNRMKNFQGKFNGMVPQPPSPTTK
jgi:hypothetical protein